MKINILQLRQNLMNYYTQLQAHHCRGTVPHTVVLQDIHMFHIIAALI